MSGGTSQQPSGSTTTTTTTSTTTSSSTTTTTTTGNNPGPVAGGYVHNFTENGTASDYYTITGNLSTGKGTVEYGGKTLTQCLKMESATNITFKAANAGKITLVFVEPAATIKIDGTKYTASGDGIITVDLEAGDHAVTKADTANLFYMVYAESTTNPNPEISWGDANCDGQVDMSDAVLIMQSNSNPDKYGLNGSDPTHITEQGLLNADVFENGASGVTNQDALSIQKWRLQLIPALPES